MILNISDVSSLDLILGWWEIGEYLSEAIVILGCAGEFTAEFTNRIHNGDEHKKSRLSKSSLLVLIGGLATGLVCLMGATVTSGKIIALLTVKASEADERSRRLETSNKQLGIDLTTAKSELATKQSGLETALEQERQKTARFQKDADIARLALGKELKMVSARQLPRQLDRVGFINILNGHPKGKAEIWFVSEDQEAFLLATEIYDALGFGTQNSPGAGWEVVPPVPIPEQYALSKTSTLPASQRLGPWFGVSILSKRVVEPPSSWMGTPHEALTVALGLSLAPRSGLSGAEIPSLPDNMLIIVVGLKL
jgi:hypothetical protein